MLGSPGWKPPTKPGDRGSAACRRARLAQPSLPEDFALTEPTPAPRRPIVRARHAASLLILRQGARDAGPELLMGLRGSTHRFAPNRLVFPGGSVDPGDATAPIAAPPRPATQQALERAATPAMARALAYAAARELEEETGLTLGTPPRLDGLRYLCRAVTPHTQPIRFNARFLVVAADAVSGTLAGSGELEGLRWYGVAEALALDLALATRRVLEQLQIWLALPDEARDGRDELMVLRQRAWAKD